MANDVTLPTHRTPGPRPAPAGGGGPEMYLRVQHSEPGSGVHVYVLIGEIDLYTVPLLERTLSTAENSAVRALVVDLSRVEFLAACGVSALLGAAHRASHHRRSFVLVVGTAAVRRVLDLTEASRHLTTYGNLSDAVDAAMPRAVEDGSGR